MLHFKTTTMHDAACMHTTWQACMPVWCTTEVGYLYNYVQMWVSCPLFLTSRVGWFTYLAMIYKLHGVALHIWAWPNMECIAVGFPRASKRRSVLLVYPFCVLVWCRGIRSAEFSWTFLWSSLRCGVVVGEWSWMQRLQEQFDAPPPTPPLMWVRN